MSQTSMRPNPRSLFPLALLAAFIMACPDSERASPPEDAPAAGDVEEQAPHDHARAHDDDHDHDHDHDHDSPPQPPSDEPMDITLGEPIQEDVPLVPVDELMKSGEKYEGQTVRVEGRVTDMCHHRRGWFGVASEDGKRLVRVAVTDEFLAPENAIGARAAAQGKVEIRTIAAADIEHYRSAHRFLPPEALDSEEDVKLPTIVAAGATFER